MNLYTKLYKKAAENLGLKFELFNGKSIIIYKGKKQISFIAAGYGEHKVWFQKIASNKELTKKILKRNNLPVFKSKVFEKKDINKALKYARYNLCFPVVTKPLNRLGGKGITAHISTASDFKKSFIKAGKYSDRVMVEKHYEGNDYRFLVCKNRILSVSQREPAFVIGDGKTSLKNLIRNWNIHSKYKLNVNDQNIKGKLRASKLTMKDVPAKGQKIGIYSLANLHSGGISHNLLLKNIHSDYKKIALKAVKVSGLVLCGVDILSKNLKEPIRKTKAGITELNANPGIEIHSYSKENTIPDIAERVIKNLL